ncbi:MULTISPECIES: FRG domain-containing protein [unclassified Sphingobacterium]|uniref:FRG domain-containing protein n=1 Tax=unclassified Sphingobacterium TaxID=2609468 RepID=UPI0025F3B942|nr:MULTISPECIES: FRG domain-containing protein [unclassified Sphingobacterium]
MKKTTIKDIFEYLEVINKHKLKKSNILLFRGQSEKKPLIPSIARSDSKKNTTEIEKRMLEELKRRTKLYLNGNQFDDWDWLVYAQHFGMKTRLLDWSSNPLTALWFACSNEFKKEINSAVYILKNAEEFLLDKSKGISPFDRAKTRVLKPTLNNERIIAQSGWFTAHKFSSKTKSFVDLRTNIEIKDAIIEVTIPKEIKANLLESLNVFGINNQTLFPDITGICNHLNWEFNE